MRIMTTAAAPAIMSLPSDQDSTGRTLGDEEIALLSQAIRTGTLTSTKGAFVKELENRFARRVGAKHAHACSHGSAAIHTAISAIDPEPGDEIVTTAITDMGALTPILYQGAIPVFADVDPATGMVTAESVEAVRSPRTRAIVATHLFGLPAAVDAIGAMADAAGLPLVGDCAQAYLTQRAGRPVGGYGSVACFSTQQGKHLATGEGGLVVTDDDAIARRVRVFVNKGWPYGEPNPDHEFLALNLRTTELASAVANAQLDTLAAAVAHRQETVARFLDAIEGAPGITLPTVAAGDVAT